VHYTLSVLLDVPNFDQPSGSSLNVHSHAREPLVLRDLFAIAFTVVSLHLLNDSRLVDVLLDNLNADDCTGRLESTHEDALGLVQVHLLDVVLAVFPYHPHVVFHHEVLL